MANTYLLGQLANGGLINLGKVLGRLLGLLCGGFYH
jgi:hypothetical protein